MSNNNTTANDTASTASTETREVFRGRKITFKDRKSIVLPVAGTFNAALSAVVMLGTFTGRYVQDDGTVEWLDYEKVGMTFVYVDKNTGEEQEIHVQASLTDKREGLLHSIVMAVMGSDEDIELASMLGRAALINVEHKITARGKTYATVTSFGEADIKDVGVDVKDRSVYFDAITDYDKNSPSDAFKMLNRFHQWFITTRSNEHGIEPFNEALYNKKVAAYEAEQAKQAAEQAQQEPATA